MRLVNMAASTFLVCKKGLNTESLFIQATRFLCCVPIANQIQRLVIALGPTTQHHDGAIRLACVVDLLAFEQLTRFETRAERIQAEGLALPRRHGTRGGATRRGPARLLERWLEPCPVACAIAQQHDWRTRGAQRADEGDEGDRQLFRKVPLRGLAHPPG